jgi:uncharacterized membrane protein
MSKTLLGTVSLLAILVGYACSAGSGGTAGKGTLSGSGNSGSLNGTGSSTSNGGGPTFVVNATGGSPPVVDEDSGMVCVGDKCTCINIAEFGKTGAFGAVQGQDGSTAFQQWLNTKSTAVVDVYDTRTTLTPDLLAKYQIIVLQDLTNVVSFGGQQSDFWTYSADEVAAVKDWVNNGGAIISLSGYYSDNSYEITPTNQLLSFSGISYNGDDIMNGCGGSDPCYCWGNSIRITDWNRAEPMTTGITAVGAFRGRSINAPTDSTIFATNGGKNVAVGVKYGKGRVFAFGDEWVTYNSQWNDTTLTQDPKVYEDSYDPCYNKKPSQVFQIPQFWFNTISWCQPVVAKCFKITDEPIVPVQIN